MSYPKPFYDSPVEQRQSFLLIDHKYKKVLSRVYLTQTTIDMLNTPQWMRSRMWEYVHEGQTDLKFHSDC